MKLSEELTARGFIYQHSAETLEEIIDGPQRTIYLGVEPTAESVHAGNFVVYMLLRHLANAGHKIIFLVGGGTGLIGDPKPDVERPLVDAETVAARSIKIKKQTEKLLGGVEVTLVNNADWLGKIGLIEFLRDIGKHFTVNNLMKKDAIEKRLSSEEGISYTEFAYPLLQAYDYLHLHTEFGCDVQIGGSDQWGNIVAGVDLIRRKTGETVYALSVPLIVDKATGRKFGKSEGNAVWLDAEKTSPYDFYQFWFNTSDESVMGYLKIFTLLSLDEIASIEAEFNKDPSSRLAQRRLAEEVTKFVHGENVVIERPALKVKAGITLLEALLQSGLASSKREGRELIESGAVTLDENKITDPEAPLSSGVLQKGKKKQNQVKIEIEK